MVFTNKININVDNLKPILNDFMITNEIFKDFLMNLDENSHIWREIFEFFFKLDFEKNSRLMKKTQCYGVDPTQSDSLKSVKKSLN